MALAGDELLPAIDVVGRTREGLIDHDVDGERSHVGWTDDPPDGKSGAELIAAGVEIIAEERCRQRRVGWLFVEKCTKLISQRFGLLFCDEVAAIRHHNVLYDVASEGFYKRLLRFPERGVA